MPSSERVPCLLRHVSCMSPVAAWHLRSWNGLSSAVTTRRAAEAWSAFCDSGWRRASCRGLATATRCGPARATRSCSRRWTPRGGPSAPPSPPSELLQFRCRPPVCWHSIAGTREGMPGEGMRFSNPRRPTEGKPCSSTPGSAIRAQHKSGDIRVKQAPLAVLRRRASSQKRRYLDSRVTSRKHGERF